MANGKKWYDIVNVNTLLYLGAGFLGYVYIVRPITDKLGITKSAAATSNDAALTNADSAFSPTFWKNAASKNLQPFIIKEDAVQQYIKTIYNYASVFNDNYSAVLGVFQQLKTKSQVSYLCDRFQQKYNQTLLQWLRDPGGIFPWDGLSEDHINMIVTYVNSLPDYKA